MSAARARIEIVAGPGTGTFFALDSERSITVGRAADVEVSCPTDTSLSRRHAELQLVDSSVHVRDLGSRHGVFVNGKRAEHAELADGDEVQVGELVLRVVLEGPQRTSGTMMGWSVSKSRPRTRPVSTLPAGYEYVRVLGAGAMGNVVLARHIASDEQRAIKQIVPAAAMSEKARAMFLREANVQARLIHPNVIRVHSVDQSDDGVFSIVMEYVNGGSVGDRLRVAGPLPPARAVAITIAVLDGLAHAHALGIIHRDIKEDNILLTDEGLPKLADFGLAKNYQESGASGITSEGAVAGTVPYMAREQLLDYKNVRPPADIYSVGATLYRVLTGRFPRNFTRDDNWLRVALETPVIPINACDAGLMLSPALCAIVHRALATDPGDRYATASEMRAALAALS